MWTPTSRCRVSDWPAQPAASKTERPAQWLGPNKREIFAMSTTSASTIAPVIHPTLTPRVSRFCPDVTSMIPLVSMATPVRCSDSSMYQLINEDFLRQEWQEVGEILAGEVRNEIFWLASAEGSSPTATLAIPKKRPSNQLSFNSRRPIIALQHQAYHAIDTGWPCQSAEHRSTSVPRNGTTWLRKYTPAG